jgi:hypothetical protein
MTVVRKVVGKYSERKTFFPVGYIGQKKNVKGTEEILARKSIYVDFDRNIVKKTINKFAQCNLN